MAATQILGETGLEFLESLSQDKTAALEHLNERSVHFTLEQAILGLEIHEGYPKDFQGHFFSPSERSRSGLTMLHQPITGVIFV